MNFNADSFDKLTNSFYSESKQLEKSINNALEKSEKLSIPEIVGNYFQIMNITSQLTVLKKHLDDETNTKDAKILSARIVEIENLISEKFNKNLHPFVMSQLTKSIQESTRNLQSNQTQQKSKEQIEAEAKLYAKLREIMSTKEFVEQYDNGLTDD